MKAELFLQVLLSIIILAVGFIGIVSAAPGPVDNGLPLTIGIGGSTTSTTTTTPQVTNINNPSNINFQIVARDENGLSKQLNVSLYDDVGHTFLNSTQFTGLGYLYSPTSLADFEFTHDNNNLDVNVNGLNLTGMGGTLSNILVQNSNPLITNYTVYRSYRVELPSTFNYNGIVLKINLADLNGVNYNNLAVFRCGTYNSAASVCSDPTGWVSVPITVNSNSHFVTLSINHFSVYSVAGSTNGTSQTTTTTTTTPTQSTTTSSTQTTTYSAPPASNPAPASSGSSSSGGGGGGGGSAPAVCVLSNVDYNHKNFNSNHNNSTSNCAKHHGKCDRCFAEISINWLVWICRPDQSTCLGWRSDRSCSSGRNSMVRLL